MRIHLLLAISLIGFWACKGEETSGDVDTGESEELAQLRSENRALQDQLAEKDSVINESIMLINEIEENLAMINLKEDEIRFKSRDQELQQDSKEWILQEIQNINYLREANQKKINELNQQLDNQNLQIEQFQAMITNLMNKIQVQEEEIELLRAELEDLDREYVELLEAYNEQTELTTETLKELNKAFYVYGTEKELLDNGVIVKEGGFIGIGKKTALKDDFNEDYFTSIDMMRTKKIDVTGKEIQIMTDHPSFAYSINSSGQKHTISISDPKSFWKVSRYLVVVVD